MSDWTTLVSAEDLAAALGRDDLIVVDARFGLNDTEAGEAAYRQAHVPGARYAHLDRDLSDHRKSGGGRHPWPEADDFTAALGRWGITAQHQVVVYDNGDGALAAARLWFLLRVLGHQRVAVLDGGWQRWTALGLPSDDLVPTPTATRYEASYDARRVLDAQDVRSLLDSGGLLIDARAGERFRGEVEPLDRVAGHVPGARNRPYANNLADGRFKSSETLAGEFAPLLAGYAPAQTAVMCGSGVTACHHLLAMAHAGFDGAALYTGSWSGWIEDPQRPVAVGEG
ncbi:rhodanese-like domain protein [Lysobacter antibioticus]|uniref:sulfurtransferase n=1 Tax=Lysobacter antibioticus TaxID=84531 RepID=UPI00071743B2|nr:sulfurtransferase [Lysobacter antibioticus]ALN62410.1 rhodanese-like domain protein [Lysobacter antibioticus]